VARVRRAKLAAIKAAIRVHDLREASVVFELRTMTLETLWRLREIERQHQEVREGFKMLPYYVAPVQVKSPLPALPTSRAPQAARPESRADKSPAFHAWRVR